jgi:nitrogen regulatory protein P-II 1
MKRIEATIRLFNLDEVKDALNAIGIQGMTVTKVNGFGKQETHIEIYRAVKNDIDFISKVRFEVIAENGLVEKVVKTIQEKAKTGKIDDGNIFVSTLDEVIRIRTGEIGETGI